MSKPNGRQKKAIEGLAAALRPPPTEMLAAALNECFEAATEAGTKHVDAALARQDAALARQDAVLEKQNDTLRMIWTQCGGRPDQRLPIDD